jgi:hypothetical protein
MYVCIRDGPLQPLHRDPRGLLCFPFLWLSLQQTRTSDVVQDFIRGDVEVVTWFHKISAQVTESQVS